MEVVGKIIKILSPQTGQGKNGAWIKNEFIIETPDQYPKKICISTWGDMATNMDNYEEGERVSVKYNLESREYNERWFTEVKAYKIERQVSGKTEQKQQKEELQKGATDGNSDDLPF